MNIDLSNLSKIINEVYKPAFKYKGRFLVLYGGSGSGKSFAIAQKIITRMLKENNHNILCVRNTGNSVSKSQFPLLCGVIRDWGLSEHFTINKAVGQEKITCNLNGNQIIFSGLDDVEKLKSIYNVTSIWIEEASEVQIEDFRELNRRLRGYQGKNKDGSTKYMQIMISFNPVSSLHWLKANFFDKENEDALVIHSTYKDNKYIDEAYKKEMEKLKESSEYEYNVYALGMWGIVGGAYFDGEKVTYRINDIKDKKPLRRGYFEFRTTMTGLIEDRSIRFIENKDGYIKIYKDVDKTHPYVIGGDTAGDGSDYNVGQVVDNITDEQVATMRTQIDEDLYAKQMYCLGKYFNYALIGPETNFSTHPVKELERLGYKNLYIRESTPDSFSGRLQDKYGFNTNKKTRPDLLAKLRTIVRETPELINDIDTLYEMTTFVINEKGKAEAAQGQHDDCIMALGITHYIKEQQSKKLIEVKEEDETAKFLSKVYNQMVQDMTGGSIPQNFFNTWG